MSMMNEAVNAGAWQPFKANRRDEDTGGGAHESGRILIVDDEFEMRHVIVDYLAAQNLRAIPVQGRQEMARQFAAGEPSLVVLDLCLGEDDGLDLLRDIRSHSDVPVIITSGHRRDEIDVVLGLELGADDYLAKPFGLRELLARIRAVLRRREAKLFVAERDSEWGRYRFGGWELDRRKRRLKKSGRVSGPADQRRVHVADRLCRRAAATAQPRASHAGEPRPRGRLRS
jgi:two-component system OmpR family response regulator